jgi:hypothetical protein
MIGIDGVHVETSLGEIKTIENVLYVLRMKKSLLLIVSIANRGYYVVFYDKRCFIINKHFQKVVVVGVQNEKNGLYRLDMIIIPNRSVEFNNFVSSTNQLASIIELSHYQTTCVNYLNLHFFATNKMAIGISYLPYNASLMRFIARKTQTIVLPKNTLRDTTQLESVNVDLCEPFLVKSFLDSFYFMTFIDDLFRKARVYF